MATRILLIEDDQDTAEMTPLWLGQHGYDVVAAPDAMKAIRLVAILTPNVVILDHNVPRMSCESFVRTVATLSPGATFILVSGITNLKERAAELGIDFYLEKPFEPQALLALVQKITEPKRP